MNRKNWIVLGICIAVIVGGLLLISFTTKPSAPARPPMPAAAKKEAVERAAPVTPDTGPGLDFDPNEFFDVPSLRKVIERGEGRPIEDRIEKFGTSIDRYFEEWKSLQMSTEEIMSKLIRGDEEYRRDKLEAFVIEMLEEKMRPERRAYFEALAKALKERFERSTPSPEEPEGETPTPPPGDETPPSDPESPDSGAEALPSGEAPSDPGSTIPAAGTTAGAPN